MRSFLTSLQPGRLHAAGLQNTVRRLSSAAGALLLVTALSACGGSDSSPPPTGAPPAQPAANQIGPAGGTIQGPNGSSLQIPAGALATTQTFAIAIDASGAPAVPAGATAASDIYAITPHGTAFSQPATVSVPYNPQQIGSGQQPVLLRSAGAAQGWDVVTGASFAGGMATATTSSLSWWKVISGSQPQITRQPQNVTVAAGDRADFDVIVVGLAPLSYQWLLNGTPIQGATTPMFSVLSASAADNGARFSVRITNALGTTTSAEAILTVSATPPPPPASVPRQQATRIATAAEFSAAVRADGTLWMWGYRPYIPMMSASCLDPGDFRSPCRATGVANAIAVAAAQMAVVVLRNDGRVLVFGFNDLLPEERPHSSPREMPVLENIVQIAAGDSHALALRNDGQVFAWGQNSRGQLGDNTTTPKLATPVAVPGMTNVVAIDASGNWSFAVRADGTVWGWGEDPSSFGIVAPGTPYNLSTPTQIPGIAGMGGVAAGLDNTIFWGAAPTVPHLVGRAVSGLAGNAPPVRALTNVPPFTRAAIGWYYNINTQAASSVVAALAANGTVTGYGAIASGINGITGFNNVVEVAAGKSQHILLVRSDGTVWGWGSNNNGELGDRTTERRESPVQVIGINLN